MNLFPPRRELPYSLSVLFEFSLSVLFEFPSEVSRAWIYCFCYEDLPGGPKGPVSPFWPGAPSNPGTPGGPGKPTEPVTPVGGRGEEFCDLPFLKVIFHLWEARTGPGTSGEKVWLSGQWILAAHWGPGWTQLLPAEPRRPLLESPLSLNLSPELPQASCGCYVAARPGKGQAKGTERGAGLTSLLTKL